MVQVIMKIKNISNMIQPKKQEAEVLFRMCGS